MSGFLSTTMIVATLGVDGALADDGDDEIPFSKALVLLQLNDTDGDPGFHARIDGEPWKRMSIENPAERVVLEVKPRRQLRRQGMAEVSFESREPPFDELGPDAFVKRFPEGKYEISGRTLAGKELESTGILSHVIPAPAENILSGGTSIEFNCEDEVLPVLARPYTISWDPVLTAHPEIGPARPIEVSGYELVIERIEGVPLKFQVNLDADLTAFTVPDELIMQGDTLKVEVLVVASNGNETGREACFVSAE